MVRESWNVRAFIKCPVCGEEMEMMGGPWYYANDLKLVDAQCRLCGLEINEYSEHRVEESEQVPYFEMVKRLRGRLLAAGLEEVEGGLL